MLLLENKSYKDFFVFCINVDNDDMLLLENKS